MPHRRRVATSAALAPPYTRCGENITIPRRGRTVTRSCLQAMVIALGINLNNKIQLAKKQPRRAMHAATSMQHHTVRAPEPATTACFHLALGWRLPVPTVPRGRLTGMSAPTDPSRRQLSVAAAARWCGPRISSPAHGTITLPPVSHVPALEAPFCVRQQQQQRWGQSRREGIKQNAIPDAAMAASSSPSSAASSSLVTLEEVQAAARLR